MGVMYKSCGKKTQKIISLIDKFWSVMPLYFDANYKMMREKYAEKKEMGIECEIGGILKIKKKTCFRHPESIFPKKVQFQLFSSLDRPFQCLLNNSRENDKQKFGRFFLIGSFNIFFLSFFHV